MNRPVRWMVLGLCLLLCMVSGCGGNPTTPPSNQVRVYVSPKSATLSASETQQFTAAVANATNTAVTWTLSGCSGDACGTINSSGLYTAPSLIPNYTNVAVIATLQTDSTIKGAATVENAPLSVAVSPAQSLSLGAQETQVITASITGHPNRDVRWSLSGTGCTGKACGTLTNVTGTSVSFNGPVAVPNRLVVTVTATSVADNSKYSSVTIQLMPISVAVVPSPETVAAPSGTRNFRAVLQYDPTNAGVTWNLSGAGCPGDGCGTLTDVTSSSAIYHAPDITPDPPTVTLTATSVTDNTKSDVSTIMVSGAVSALKGKYAFLIRGYRRVSGIVTVETMAGHFDADGNGDFVGLWDANRGPTSDQAQSIIGTYTIHPDGHGSMTIEAGKVLLRYSLTIDPQGTTARLAEATTGIVMETPGTLTDSVPDVRESSGIITRQDTGSFALSSVAGDRVIALFSQYDAALGRFTSSAGGILSDGVADLSWPKQTGQQFTHQTPLTGSFGPPDPGTGRGTATLTTDQGVLNFAYYVVSNQSILLVQTDACVEGMPTLAFGGEVRRQMGAGAFTNASLNAPLIFNLSGMIGLLGTAPLSRFWGPKYPVITIGQIQPNGAGWLALTSDENGTGTVALNHTDSGGYSVEANGRVALTLPAAVNFTGVPIMKALAYLTDQNTGFLIQEGLRGPAFGSFEPQTGGPFGLNALSGTFRFNTGFPTTIQSLNSSGLLTLGEDGTAAATLSGAIGDFSGVLSVDPSGRAVLTLTTSVGTDPGHMILWAISSSHWVALFRGDAGYARPVLVQLERVK